MLGGLKIYDYLKSKNIQLKLVEKEDAEFILTLRMNSNLNKFLNTTNNDLEEQKRWIEEYKKRESKKLEYYFRIDSIEGEKLGLIRIYDINYEKSSFTWGSWILKEERPKYAALESAILSYVFAFEVLGLEHAYLDVRKQNEVAINFYDRFGAKRISEDDKDYYYKFEKDDFIKLKKEKYSKYI